MKKLLLPAILTLVLAACIVGTYIFRGVPQSQPAAAPSPIDERLMQTARQMAASADTSDEQALAHEALRLADHELDQAFATALREATASTTPLSGPLKQLADHISRLKAQIASEQTQIAKLTKEAAADDAAAGRLELAKAQLALDEDELGDAQEDLARQGGDRHAKIELLLKAHEAAGHETAQPKTSQAGRTDTLRERLESWLSLRNRERQVEAAREQASKNASTLDQEHRTLEGQANKAREQEAAATVSRLHHLSEQSKSLAEFDKRIQDSQQLADVYKRWGALAETRRRGVLHLLFLSLSMMLGILLAVAITDRFIRHAFDRKADRRRRHHLRLVATIAVQLVGAVLVLIVIFGPPSQLSTLIGLTTAGLTVALKDFILSFIGWFALMGRNGVRVGDWVEIEGVGGEVIEIGILKTVLLEVGTWTNTGHPTGRRVAFLNKFAIENHYFNFSTAGQWLWDELQMTLPLASDPYRTALAIRERVERETEADATTAERDWERVTHQYGTRAFSAKPEVDLRPSINGLEVVVRYITRAPQRYEVKSKLFQAIVELVHKPVT